MVTKHKRKMIFQYIIAVYDSPTLLSDLWNQPDQEIDISEFVEIVRDRPVRSIVRGVWEGVKLANDIAQLSDKDQRRCYVMSISDTPSFTKELNKAFRFKTITFAQEFKKSIARHSEIIQVKV